MNKMSQSLKDNKIGIMIMTLASLFTATGQLFWKLANGSINGALFGGFLLYFIGAVCMIVAFRYGSLSVIHPLLSLGYVFALFFGWFFLNEMLTPTHLLGTLSIIVGATLIGGGDH